LWRCRTGEGGAARISAPPLLETSPISRLALLQIHGRGLSSIAALEVEAHLLALVQIADTGTLDRRDMNKHILRTVLGLNEAVTLRWVEPLHGSNRHRSSFKNKLPPLGDERRVKLRHGAGSRSGARSELGRA